MKKRIYDYIKDNPCASIHKCSEKLKIEEMDVLKIINELSNDGFVVMHPLPLGNKIDADNSCFYTVGKEYKESEVK